MVFGLLNPGSELVKLPIDRLVIASPQIERIILPGHQYCYPTNYQNQSELHHCSYSSKTSEQIVVVCFRNFVRILTLMSSCANTKTSGPSVNMDAVGLFVFLVFI